jgi:hypothetical protein
MMDEKFNCMIFLSHVFQIRDNNGRKLSAGSTRERFFRKRRTNLAAENLDLPVLERFLFEPRRLGWARSNKAPALLPDTQLLLPKEASALSAQEFNSISPCRNSHGRAWRVSPGCFPNWFEQFEGTRPA